MLLGWPFFHRLFNMNEARAGQGCRFESLLMTTYGPNKTCPWWMVQVPIQQGTEEVVGQRTPVHLKQGITAGRGCRFKSSPSRWEFLFLDLTANKKIGPTADSKTMTSG